MQVLTEKEIIIIGGGVAGIGSALKLANQGHRVKILEKNTLMSGSSGRNPGRMGHGFHYFDEHTAIQYLRASIQVQRAYPGFLVGDDLPFQHPIRHGRYYITKSSLHSYEDILVIYRVIQDEYTRLVEQDPRNKVFGEPQEFIKILAPQDYAHVINSEIVAGAVETCEHLFNWPKFSQHIKALLLAHPNISLLEHAEVVGISPRETLDARFTIDVACSRPSERDSEPEVHSLKLKTDFLINASWENIEYLNSTAGIPYLDGTRTNRLKCLLVVELPPELTNPQMNSAFFCMGSFCMFSNMGDGRGMMTLADVTNMKVSSHLRIDKEMEYYLSDKVDKQEMERIGQEILNGVAEYIPLMANARILEVKFGIVQTKGNLQLEDLKSSKSSHHKRSYYAVRAEQQGLISNPAMKLFYFVHNSMLVYDIFKTQLEKESYLPEFYTKLFIALGETLTLETQKSIMRYVDRALTTEDLEDTYFSFPQRLEAIFHLIIQKQKYLSVLSYMMPRVNEVWPNVKRRISLHNSAQMMEEVQGGQSITLKENIGEYIRYRERAFIKKEIFFDWCCRLVLSEFPQSSAAFRTQVIQECVDSILLSEDFDAVLMRHPKTLFFAEQLLKSKYQKILDKTRACSEMPAEASQQVSRSFTASAFDCTEEKMPVEAKKYCPEPLLGASLFFSNAVNFEPQHAKTHARRKLTFSDDIHIVLGESAQSKTEKMSRTQFVLDLIRAQDPATLSQPLYSAKSEAAAATCGFDGDVMQGDQCPVALNRFFTVCSISPHDAPALTLD